MVQVEVDAARVEVQDRVVDKVEVEVEAEVQGRVVDRVWGVVVGLLVRADNVSVRIAARLLPISRVCLVLT